MVEYGLVLALVAVICVIALSGLGLKIMQLFMSNMAALMKVFAAMVWGSTG